MRGPSDASDSDNDESIDDASEPQHEFSEPRAGSRYDPAPARERIRGRLAQGFAALLVVMSVGPLGLVAFDVVEWSEIEGPTTLVFGSVVGIVGAVLGFYFGSKEGGR